MEQRRASYAEKAKKADKERMHLALYDLNIIGHV